MKQYVDFALRKAKKPIDREMLYLKIAELIKAEDESYIELSSDDKNKIDEIESYVLII